MVGSYDDWDGYDVPCPWSCQEGFQQNQTAFLIVDPISLPFSIICSIMLAATFFFGIPASVLVITCFAKNRKLWTLTNAIIVNISVSDLVMFSLGVPLAFVVVVINPQGRSVGYAACKLQTFVSSMFSTVTLLTLDAVTLNRYIAVAHPFAGSDGWTKKLDKILLISSWVVGFLFATVEAALPNTSSSFYERCLMRRGTLYDYRALEFEYALLYLMVPVGSLSMIFVSVAYIKIVCVVRNQHRKIAFEGQHSPSMSIASVGNAKDKFMMKRSPKQNPRVTIHPLVGDLTARSCSSVSEAAVLENRNQTGTPAKQPGTALSASYLTLPGVGAHSSDDSKRSGANVVSSPGNACRRKSSVSQLTNRHRANMKNTASKRSVYIVMAFFTAWLPLPSIIIISWCYQSKVSMIDELTTFFYCVMLTSRLAHPFLYANFSRDFHKEFKKLWRFVAKRKPAFDVSVG